MAKKNLSSRAAFITIEGLEGSGKSSVISYLSSFLKKRGFRVKVFREPGSTCVGEKIREILLDKKNSRLSVHTELLLYLAARTQLIEEKLFKALGLFDIVICDRFFDSTLVYQGFGLGLGKIAESSVKMFSLGLDPDLTLVLDTEPLKGLRRLKKKDRIESRPLTFHSRLRKGYLALAEKFPKRIKVINAGGSLEDIFPQVSKQIDIFLSRYARKRINP
ncbi:MAG: dTMP kinase [Candidatus Omnitrophica bacterium]|nr:dTMP kinase [Candidatus Omnitrophota bacterium]